MILTLLVIICLKIQYNYLKGHLFVALKKKIISFNPFKKGQNKKLFYEVTHFLLLAFNLWVSQPSKKN